jgi:hypothetical protein
MASYHIENDIDSMEEDVDGERFLHPLYDDLYQEKNRREILKLKTKKKLYDDCTRHEG